MEEAYKCRCRATGWQREVSEWTELASSFPTHATMLELGSGETKVYYVPSVCQDGQGSHLHMMLKPTASGHDWVIWSSTDRRGVQHPDQPEQAGQSGQALCTQPDPPANTTANTTMATPHNHQFFLGLQTLLGRTQLPGGPKLRTRASSSQSPAHDRHQAVEHVRQVLEKPMMSGAQQVLYTIQRSRESKNLFGAVVFGPNYAPEWNNPSMHGFLAALLAPGYMYGPVHANQMPNPILQKRRELWESIRELWHQFERALDLQFTPNSKTEMQVGVFDPWNSTIVVTDNNDVTKLHPEIHKGRLTPSQIWGFVTYNYMFHSLNEFTVSDPTNETKQWVDGINIYHPKERIYAKIYQKKMIQTYLYILNQGGSSLDEGQKQEIRQKLEDLKGPAEDAKVLKKEYFWEPESNTWKRKGFFNQDTGDWESKQPEYETITQAAQKARYGQGESGSDCAKLHHNVHTRKGENWKGPVLDGAMTGFYLKALIQYLTTHIDSEQESLGLNQVPLNPSLFNLQEMDPRVLTFLQFIVIRILRLLWRMNTRDPKTELIDKSPSKDQLDGRKKEWEEEFERMKVVSSNDNQSQDDVANNENENVEVQETNNNNNKPFNLKGFANDVFFYVKDTGGEVVPFIHFDLLTMLFDDLKSKMEAEVDALTKLDWQTFGELNSRFMKIRCNAVLWQSIRLVFEEKNRKDPANATQVAEIKPLYLVLHGSQLMKLYRLMYELMQCKATGKRHWLTEHHVYWDYKDDDESNTRRFKNLWRSGEEEACMDFPILRNVKAFRSVFKRASDFDFLFDNSRGGKKEVELIAERAKKLVRVMFPTKPNSTDSDVRAELVKTSSAKSKENNILHISFDWKGAKGDEESLKKWSRQMDAMEWRDAFTSYNISNKAWFNNIAMPCTFSRPTYAGTDQETDAAEHLKEPGKTAYKFINRQGEQEDACICLRFYVLRPQTLLAMYTKLVEEITIVCTDVDMGTVSSEAIQTKAEEKDVPHITLAVCKKKKTYEGYVALLKEMKEYNDRL